MTLQNQTFMEGVATSTPPIFCGKNYPFWKNKKENIIGISSLRNMVYFDKWNIYSHAYHYQYAGWERFQLLEWRRKQENAVQC